MPENRAKRGNLKFWVLTLGLLLLGFAGIAAHNLHWLGDPWGILAGGLGEALVIAALLGVTVDQHVKRELAHEVAQDVAAAVAGSDAPEEIRQSIKASFKPELLIRRNHRHRYKIEKIPQEPGFVKVTSVIDYEVLNYSREPYEDSPFSELAEVTNPQFELLSVDATAVVGAELQVMVERRHPNLPGGIGFKRVRGRKVVIPGASLTAPLVPVRVRWIQSQRFDSTSEDVIFLAYHINAEVEVDKPGDFTFWVEPRDDSDRKIVSTSDVNIWRYKGLFKNDLIRVRWWPTRPEETNGSPL